MNWSGLSDSVAMTGTLAQCPRCSTTARLSRGLCLGCLLGSALDEADQSPQDDFVELLAAVPASDTFRRLGNYEVLEEIGRGGMGVIYRARQRRSRRIVALKRVLSYHAESRETLARFRREAEATSSLDHPNILPIYEVGETEGGIPYFSMKYAPGGTLQEIAPALRDKPREIVRLLAKVTRAVEYAHCQGILHRDLKPGNILLDARVEPLVSDFGLAKWLDSSTDLTRTLTIFGTPGYIAPEQARSSRSQLTPAADVYSLGAILFDLLTGRPPFLGEHALAVIQQASEKEAPKLRSLAAAVDRDLETICAKCLEREPQARYQSAGALADDLERWLEGRPIVARPILPPTRAWRWAKRNPTLATVTIAALVFATAAAFLFFSHNSTLTPAPSDKSIAVLPFENLSDKENLYFTQGIQDEILTKLANIADLRVTGRASVMEYQAAMARDTRSIGRELGVAHLLTGSMQRTGDQLRVSVRLIDTRDDTQVWAKTYDRPLADVFSIESNIIKTTAAQLHATLLPNEKSAIERPPTRDLTAFALYAQAKELVLKLGLTGNLRPTLEQAADLLNRAVSHDPKFLLAYCQLAFVHDLLYFFGHDHTPARLALAEAAMQSALRINPNAGETHLARARHLYYGYLKYDEARAEMLLAERSLPNDPLIFQLRAFIDRRQNRWKEAERDLKRALERDPRNSFILQQLSLLYEKDRRYPEIAAVLDRALAIIPGDIDTRVDRAVVDLNWRADTQPLYATIQSILEEKPDAAKQIADSWLLLALCERDAAAAEHALTALGQDSFAPDAILLNHTFGEGLIGRMIKDETKARDAFTRARAEQEKILQEQPDYGPTLCVLGLIDAALGRKEDALREGRRALELLPPAKDAINGGHIQFFFAITCAWAGEKDLAIEQLATLAQSAGFVTYGTLKLHPFWDPLRGDPRFEKIVASLAPKTGVTGESAGLPNKSIAVLPFENLSDKENVYFTQGIQDEILTDLAMIADLRVISRTSVMQYQPEMTRDARAIGQALGVNYLVEGSVQRASGKVRVNAQLINARNDAHVWAHTYDGDLADVFAIQSQIATAIATALETKLSPREKAAIEQAPTINLVAFDLYSHAKALNLSVTYTGAHRQVLLQAADLLNQAVARDPSFFQAHCQLVDAYTELYLLGIDRSRERLALAEKALDTAFRLQPDAGEAHLSRALYLYRVHLDYDGALRELQSARETLPNSAGVFELTGYIRRRQGYWDDSVQNLKRSLELDPRNTRTLQQMAISYYGLRRYSDMIAVMDRVLAIKPDDIETQALRASIEEDWKADTRPMRRVIDSIRKNNPANLPTVADFWLMSALADRNPTDAEAALAALGDGNFGTNWVELNHRFAEGLVARMTKDDPRAHAAFTAARVAQEKVVKAQPDFGPAWCALGLIDAGLGRKEEALREGRHAIELLPMEKDALNGAHMIEFFGVIAAWVGEKGLACEQLEKTTRMTRGWIVSYGKLKLSPVWDPLRGDPCFEKIVASLAPQTGVTGQSAVLPNKSIAVLPFANLSDKENVYFTQGIQDEILTHLANIADLRVISRTSVMQYQPEMARDARAIGQTLGVNYLVEGSVQRAAGKVRVNAQLINARNDAHVWAHTYDGDLADVFAIQSQIAKAIASALETKISPREKAAIEQAPTVDVVAFDLYSHAKTLNLSIAYTAAVRQMLLQAADLLTQALARDASFFQAECLLADIHTEIYLLGFDRSSERLSMAQKALDAAARLQPDAGEVHLIRAQYLFRCHLDYGGALRELQIAGETLHNSPRLFELTGYIRRRQGYLEEGLQNYERALKFDPGNIALLHQTAMSYYLLRRYPDLIAVLDRALTIKPDDVETEVTRASAELSWKGDTRPMHRVISSIRKNDPAKLPSIADTWFVSALAERNSNDAETALVALGDGTFGTNSVQLNRKFGEGLLARMIKDDARAHAAFTAARLEQEKVVKAQADYGPAWCILGLIDAGLGRKEEALREGRRAIELLSVEKDAISGANMIEYFAITAAWVGEKELACEQLEMTERLPGGWFSSYGLLKLSPVWDPLRGHPRFENIVASLAPKN